MHEVGQWNKKSVQVRKTQVKLSQVPERSRRCLQYMLHDIFFWCFLVRFIHFGNSAQEKVQETHDKNMNNAKQCKENINNATEIHKKCKWHVCAQDCPQQSSCRRVFEIALTLGAISKLAPFTDKWGIQTLASLGPPNRSMPKACFELSKAWLQLIPCGWSCYRWFEFGLENILKTNFWFIQIDSKFF